MGKTHNFRLRGHLCTDWKFRSAPCICYSCSSVSKFASFTRPTPNWKLIALRRSINNHYNPTNNNPNHKSCNLFFKWSIVFFSKKQRIIGPGCLVILCMLDACPTLLLIQLGPRLRFSQGVIKFKTVLRILRPGLYCYCAVCYTVH